MTDLPGEIGGYRVQRVLAEGGRGTVYAALQQRPRRTVALKVIRESVAGAAALRHLQRQAQVMARLRQPGIVQVFEAGTDTIDGDPVAFLVMEYVPRARTILEFLRSVELDHAARLRLFIRIAVAVDHAHRRKIIHHALRPGNVLVDEAGQPKVINFGDPIDRAELAATSLDYVSPEQLDPSPRDLSVRCDVYSLGVIMFEMLTETRPYELQGLSADTALDVIRDNEPVRPSTVVPEVSAPLESVILRAISTSPAQRYPNAGELAKAVHQFLETGGAGRREPAGSEPATPSEPKPLPRPRLWPAMVIAVVVLGLVGGGIYLTREQWWPKPVDPPTPPSDVNAGSGGPSPQPGPAPPPAMFPLLGHTGDVVGLRFAPGGVMLATGSADRSLILYDLESRETVLTLEDLLPTAAFTADGTRMLVAAEDAAEIRDTATGRVGRGRARRPDRAARGCLAWRRPCLPRHDGAVRLRRRRHGRRPSRRGLGAWPGPGLGRGERQAGRSCRRLRGCHHRRDGHRRRYGGRHRAGWRGDGPIGRHDRALRCGQRAHRRGGVRRHRSVARRGGTQRDPSLGALRSATSGVAAAADGCRAKRRRGVRRQACRRGHDGGRLDYSCERSVAAFGRTLALVRTAGFDPAVLIVRPARLH
jgi:serine/threonine protein kinase